MIDPASAIGNVIAASGARLAIAIDTTGGRGAPEISISDMLKTSGTGPRTFALASDIETIVGADGRAQVMIQAELLGKVDESGTFDRGVNRHPPLGAAVFMSDESDVATLYEGRGEDRIRIGTIVRNTDLTAYADVSKTC